jgi:tripartite-type tricarboxylate transporter receptor subunit TctC
LSAILAYRSVHYVACAVAYMAVAVSANAQTSDFYAGKQIRLVVSTAPGGGYDAYARVLAQFLGNHIPGHPAIVVDNMPGASGLKAASYIGSVAPRDGTVIAGTHSEVLTAPLLTPVAAKFDVHKLSWLGSLTSDPLVGYVWHTSPVYKFEDFHDHDIIMAATSTSDPGFTIASIAKALFGLDRMRIVSGYKSSGEVRLAISRGEAQGAFAHTWSSIKAGNSDWLRDKKIRLVVQHGMHRLPELADVPLIGDFARSEDDKQAIAFMIGRQEAAKPYMAPPDVPADRLAVLRNAFDSVLKDKGFREAAAKAHLALDNPMNGLELAAFAAKISETPPAVVERVRNIIEPSR